MATYPIKLLKDESGTPFVPLTSTAALKTKDGSSLEDEFSKKLEVTNIKAGKDITLSVDGNNITINNASKGVLIDNLTTTTAGQGALDARQGKILKDSIPEVVNNLTTVSTDKALSAYQGYLLSGKIVPAGGTEGQVLKKSSSTDWALEWGDAADPNAIIGDGSIKKIVYCTLEEYNNLSTKDPETEYHIEDAQSDLSYISRDEINTLITTQTSKYLPLSGGTVTTLTVRGSNPILHIKDTVNTYNTTPDTTSYPALLWVDKNNVAMGRLELIESTDGSRLMSLYALKPGMTSGGSFFKIGWDSNGNKTSSLDGPLTISNNLTLTGSITIGSGFGKKYTFTKSVTIGDDWTDTGLAYNSLPTGAYIVYMTGIYDSTYTWQGGNVYVGLMTWYSTGTNSDEAWEISLHTTGHAHNAYAISLRTHSHAGNTTNTRLEIKSSKAFSRATDIKFTFVKMV